MNRIDLGRDRTREYDPGMSVAARRRFVFMILPLRPVDRNDRERSQYRILLHIEAVAPAVGRYNGASEIRSADGRDKLIYDFGAAHLVETDDYIVRPVGIDLLKPLAQHRTSFGDSSSLDMGRRSVFCPSRREPFPVPRTYRHGGDEKCRRKSHSIVFITGAGGLL